MWFKCAFRNDGRYSINVSVAALLLAGAVAGVPPAIGQSQTFSSGSTGADGPLSFTTAGTFYFDPTTIPNHQAGDTIFNFTTITIATGVTVRLDSRNLPGPVYWLASGAVEIDGTLDLSGLPGHGATGHLSDRAYSTPGAGGFGGGPGGGASASAEAGSGPGGGAAATTNVGTGGTFSGSQYLIPLVGGSGGGAAFCGGQPFNAGSGAGGGAVLLASSVSITVTGLVTSNGGPVGASTCGYSGGGSGGAIRLVAPTLTVSGVVSALGGSGPYAPGGNGYIRLESFQLTCSSCTNGTPYTASTPLQVSPPVAPLPIVKVTSVAGIAINANPFTFPDASINSTSPVPIVITAQGVPVGAIPNLYILSESGPDQIVAAPALAGTLASSTSTVNIAYPPGGSKGLVRVTWSQ